MDSSRGSGAVLEDSERRGVRGRISDMEFMENLRQFLRMGDWNAR